MNSGNEVSSCIFIFKIVKYQSVTDQTLEEDLNLKGVSDLAEELEVCSSSSSSSVLVIYLLKLQQM